MLGIPSYKIKKPNTNNGFSYSNYQWDDEGICDCAIENTCEHSMKYTINFISAELGHLSLGTAYRTTLGR